MELIRQFKFIVIGFVALLALPAHAINNQMACNSYDGLIKSYGFNHYWPLNEASGTVAYDTISADNGTYQNSPTLNASGPLVAPSSAVIFNGSTQYVSTASSISNPTDYTLAAWVKTSVAGGKILSFGDVSTGQSGSYDRQIWMSDAGRFYFGVYNGNTQTVRWPYSGYNDSQWHMVVATMSSTTGMTLYVDGNIAGTNPNTSSQGYSGFWRIGYDTLTGWPADGNPNGANNEYFTGAIANVAVSDTLAINASQAQALYSVGRYCSGTFVPSLPASTVSVSPTSITPVTYTCQPITVTASFAPNSDVIVNLSSTGSAGLAFYSDSNCTASTTTANILASGYGSATFYVLSTTPGTGTAIISPAGFSNLNVSVTSTANQFRWTGGGGNANWTTAANWSGGVVPGSGDNAIFGACSTNCNPTINTSISVGGIEIYSNYTGTITQASGSAIDVGHFTQGGGTFVGGNSAMGSFNFDFVMNGGTFTATSGTTQVRTWQLNSGTFNHHNGNLNWSYTSGTAPFNPSSNHYYDMTFSGSGENIASVSGYPSVYIDHSLVFNAGGTNLSQLIFEVYGNVTCSGTGFDLTGGTRIQIDGNASGQTITGVPGCWLPTIFINAGTNNVTLSGTVQTRQSYELNSVGTLTTTGSTLVIKNPTAGMIPGTATYNNVTFTADNSYNWGNLNGGTMTVAGNLVFDGGNQTTTLDNGTILVAGNVSALNGGFFPWNGSNSLNVKLTGNASGQTVSTTTWDSTIPSLEIATGTNPVTFGTTVGIATGNFTMTSVGTFTVAGSTLYLQSYLISPGAKTYNNVDLRVDATGRNLSGGTMNVGGDFTFTDTGGCALDNGTISISGNFIKAGGADSTGNASIKMVGTASNATITSDSHFFPGGSFTINKSGKTVTLSGPYEQFGASRTLTLTAGAINMANNALYTDSLVLSGTTVTKGGGLLWVGGTTVGTGSFYGGTVAP